MVIQRFAYEGRRKRVDVRYPLVRPAGDRVGLPAWRENCSICVSLEVLSF